LVSPPSRTERYTATDGGMGRAAPESPSRSTFIGRNLVKLIQTFGKLGSCGGKFLELV
jgi:hypothetical protein